MSGLYRLNGDGRATCADCAEEILEANPRMDRLAWIETEALGDDAIASCDVCDCIPSAARLSGEAKKEEAR